MISAGWSAGVFGGDVGGPSARDTLRRRSARYPGNLVLLAPAPAEGHRCPTSVCRPLPGQSRSARTRPVPARDHRRFAQMAHEEDAVWGDREDLRDDVLRRPRAPTPSSPRAFAEFAHVNAPQRDLCPSQTRFEGEIIAMVPRPPCTPTRSDTIPAGLVTSGGTGSILHGILSPIGEYAAAHAASLPPPAASPISSNPDRAPGIRQGLSPVRDREPHRPGRSRDHPRQTPPSSTRPSTTTRSSSSGRRGTTLWHDRPDRRPRALALDRGVGLRRRLSRGFIPVRGQLGYGIPPFDFRVPGWSSISADTHKLATPSGAPRSSSSGTRPCATRGTSTRSAGRGKPCPPAWTARAPAGCSPRPGPRWSTSAGGLSPDRRRDLRDRRGDDGQRPGTRGTADHGQSRASFLSPPTPSTSITSPTTMKPRGWRLQRPAVPQRHPVAVTRPQTAGRGRGLRRRPRRRRRLCPDRAGRGPIPAVCGDLWRRDRRLTTQVEAVITMIMDGMLDTQRSLPPVAQ